MLHTFDGRFYMKNEKYMKNVITITFFYVFLIFHVVEFIESMQHGRSEERRVGKECLHQCRSRWSPYH